MHVDWGEKECVICSIHIEEAKTNIISLLIEMYIIANITDEIYVSQKPITQTNKIKIIFGDCSAMKKKKVLCQTSHIYKLYFL